MYVAAAGIWFFALLAVIGGGMFRPGDDDDGDEEEDEDEDRDDEEGEEMEEQLEVSIRGGSFPPLP